MERSRKDLPDWGKRQTCGTISSTNRSKNFVKYEAPSAPRKSSISSRFAEKFFAKSGRLTAMLRLQLREAECLPSLEIVQTAEDFVEQCEMDVFPLQSMIVIESFRIDESCAAFTVLGDDLLAALGLHLVHELGELGSSTSERHDVFRGISTFFLLTILNYVQNSVNKNIQVDTSRSNLVNSRVHRQSKPDRRGSPRGQKTVRSATSTYISIYYTI